MTPKQIRARKLLSLPHRRLTSDDIRAAAAVALRRAHPDLGGHGGLDVIKKARDLLLKECAYENSLQECETCKGTGYARTNLGRRVTCPTCKGEGTATIGD